MCLVCPTPCAIRLGITGAEHTRPCWCIFRTGPMYLVCPTLCAVRLGITGAEHTRPCWYLFRTGQMCLVCPTLCAVRLGITGAEHTRPWWCIFRTGPMCLVCPTLCAVHLGITGAEHTRPCWCFVLVSLSCSASLGLYVQCLAWSVRVMYLLALVRTYTGTSCADGQHGHCTFLPVSLMCLRVRARVYTCPRLYPCTVFCYG